MTIPEDNDKTRIKSMDASSAEPANASKEQNDKEIEAAKKRAAALEEKLRKIHQKKSSLQRPANTSDKTRIAPTTRTDGAPANGHNAVSDAEADGDRTRIAPVKKNDFLATDSPAADAASAAASAEENPDKTRFAPVKRIVPDPEGDRTQFQPRQPSAQQHAHTKPAEPTSTPGTDSDYSDQDSSQEQFGLLKNRFVLEKVLGAGGMGVVYKAKDRLKVEAQDRDPYVAVKVLGEEFKTHPEAFISLQRESRKSQRIAHPNIVNVHDFDRDGDTVFMTMEFLDGHPLDQLIAQYRSIGLPRDDVWQILQGISSALTHAHNERIIHSDFKPGNIFFTNKGVAKVFDFGIARAVSKVENIEDSVDDKTMFDAGTLGAVTPAYASLEMLEGEVPDVRDDIYALGCIAYELFTGEHPYGRVNARDACEQKLKLKRIPGLTKRQWRAIEKACAFKREDRIESVEEFWRQLTQKKSRTGLLFFSFVVIVAAAGFGYTQFFMEKAPEFHEDEVRDEIEYRLRVEHQTKAINDLMAAMDFSEVWENEIFREYQSARELLGPDNSWLNDIQQKLYTSYIKQIAAALEKKQRENSRRWIDNAARYSDDTSVLTHYQTQLEQLIAAEKKAAAERERQRKLSQQRQATKKQQQEVMAEQKSAYNAAIETVRHQLSCRANISMKDLGTAIKKLREIDMAKYKSEEPSFVNSLALCLEKIGRSYPEQATDSKKAAKHLFPGNKTIAGIKIVPRDPCSKSIAGMGAKGIRAVCRDRIPRVGQGPSLVVVPAPKNGKIFAISKYETTVEEINTYCEHSGNCSALSQTNTALPATELSLSVIRGYLRWLSQETKHQYRLPTQAEWLHAAKAGSGRLDSNRNCTLNSRGIEKGGTLLKASVGKQNAWGLVNHIGNAQELVTKKGGGLLAVGGSNRTAMENCNFDYKIPHTGEKDALTTVRVLREIASPSS